METPLSIPGMPGSYVLLMRCQSAADCRVGKRATIALQKGWYAYVGSALGAGGLRARLVHHLRPVAERTARSHWHIDYLREHLPVNEVWIIESRERLEHDWAQGFLALPGATIPVPGLGASDCACPSHLFYLTKRPAIFAPAGYTAIRFVANLP
jgi:Uri superfamily endonuclease